MITVRTLREGEPFPQHLATGFESMPVMNAFCWVAERAGEIVGILMGAPCHGLIFIVRLRIVDKAPATTALSLFRGMMKDAKQMGMSGYFTYVDPLRETERALIPICRRAHGVQVVSLQVPLVGSVEEAVKF